MWWRRKETVNVNTAADLIVALRVAPDEIIVEGDNNLIEQAEKLIPSGWQTYGGGGGGGERFDRSWSQGYYSGWRLPDYTREIEAPSYDRWPQPEKHKPLFAPPQASPPSGAASYSPHLFRAQSLLTSLLKWLLRTIFFAALGWLFFVIFARVHSPAPPLTLPSFPEAGGVNYVALGWIAAAIVAMVLAYRIIMKAIQGERDVEISWKVTEKVSGKLVITKVQKTTKVSTKTRTKPKSA
jgi:hypothetical protein